MTTTLTPDDVAALEAEIAESYARADEAQAEAENAARARLEAIRPGLGVYALGTDEFEPMPHARHPVDVAAMVGKTYKPPDMTVLGWIVAGVLHWLYSDAETGKTWIALWLALALLRAGHVVVYSDEELGAKDVAARLTALGATPEECARLVYLPFENASMDIADRHAWFELLRITQPSLVIFDTATDHLVAAGLDEDKGRDVTHWVKAYPEVATSLGIATLVLDHTGKDTVEGQRPGTHAVGSRAKRAKAKVQYAIQRVGKAKPGPQSIGKVRVILTKNTLGAEIEDERVFQLGGYFEDGTQRFKIELDESMPTYEEAPDVFAITRKREIEEALKKVHPKALTKTQVFSQVGGKKTDTLRYVEEMPGEGLWRVKAEPSGKSVLYSYVPDEPVPDEGTQEGEE